MRRAPPAEVLRRQGLGSVKRTPRHTRVRTGKGNPAQVQGMATANRKLANTTEQHERLEQREAQIAAQLRPSSDVLVREWMSGIIASLLISLAVLSIAVVSPFVADAEGAVARAIPARLSHFLRDRKESWTVFNRWTW